MLKSSSVLRYRAKDVICPRPHHPLASHILNQLSALPVANQQQRRLTTNDQVINYTHTTSHTWTYTRPHSNTLTHTHTEHVTNTQATRINVSNWWKKRLPLPVSFGVDCREIARNPPEPMPPLLLHSLSLS